MFWFLRWGLFLRTIHFLSELDVSSKCFWVSGANLLLPIKISFRDYILNGYDRCKYDSTRNIICSKRNPFFLSIYCPLTHFNHQIINILLIFFVRCVPISKLCTTIKETLQWKYYHTSNRVFDKNDQIIWKPCNRKMAY